MTHSPRSTMEIWYVVTTNIS